MFGLGTGELLIIFFIILLLFGGKKLPELARSLGSAVREFNKSSREESAEKAYEGSDEDKEREAILEAAKAMGIKTEGKSLKEIAEEIAKVAEKKVQTT
ncbi:twin-arginine translocase TatA/TatE family subunit [Candidatus Bathyarchaeota archaeon]|nr:twin-arginine translocase TatA/TatE family subunit [Candidatus Bathyarchaeota archaeon]